MGCNYKYNKISMVVQVLLLKMAFKLSLEFVNLPYLPDVSGQSIIGASTIYSETPLILGSFCKRRAQQIMVSGIMAMDFMGTFKLREEV